MKVRNRIFYYSVLLVIIALAAYNLIQKALISPVVKKHLIETVGPAIMADGFDIGGIVVNLNGLRLKDILYEKENVSLQIDILKVDFSLTHLIKSLFTRGEKALKARSVSVEGCSIIINPETRPDTAQEWRFDYEDFKNILDFLKEYDYVKSIIIRDVNLSYVSDFGLQFINGMSGSAEYDEKGNIDLGLSGKFLDPEGNDIVLKGHIDNTDYSADIDLDLGENELSKFKSPFGLYNIDRGRYKGSVKVEINRYSEKELYVTGGFYLSDLDISFNNRIFLKKAGFDLTYVNGLVSFGSIRGFLNGIQYSGSGKIFNILNPAGDIFLSAGNISSGSIISLLKDTGFGELAKDITAGDENSLDLHITDKMTDPEIIFKLSSPAVKYKNFVYKDIALSGRYKTGEVFIKEAVLLGFNSVIKMSGKISDLLSKNASYELNFKTTGQLFSSFAAAGDYLKSLSVITEGRIRGLYGKFPDMDASLNAFDFKRSDEKVLSSSIRVRNGTAEISLFSDEQNKTFSGRYDFSKNSYSFSGSDMMSVVRTLTGALLVEDGPALFCEIEGDRDYFRIKTGSSDPGSALFGELEAKFMLGKEKLESFANWVPGEKNFMSRPANFRLSVSNDSIVFSDIYFDSKEVKGKAALNLKSRSLGGSVEAYNFDLGKFFGIKQLSTNTDISLKLRGDLSRPYADIFINENILKYKDAEGDSIIVSGEGQFHLENDRIRVEKLIFYEGISKIMTMSGYINDMKKIDLETYGEMPAGFINPFIEHIELAGKLKYKAGLTGKFGDIRLKNSEIILEKGSVNGDLIEKIELITAEFDSTGVLVKKFEADAGKYLNINAEGFIPYSDRAEIYVTGNFYGDLLGYLDKKTTYISDASSECEGKFTIEGWYSKPKLKELELYILDGKFRPYGSSEGFHRIRSKLFIDESMRLDVIKFIMRESATGAAIKVENSVSSENYGDIILPGGINLGHLAITVGSEGIEFNAYRMMLPDDYGNFVLKGKKDNKFRIYKKRGNLVIDGKGFLKNARITYPFLKEEKSKGRESDISFRSVFGDLELDIEIIPSGGNKYFYNAGSEEKSIWKRFVKSISQMDNELSNVNINIAADNKGLSIKGNVFKPKELLYSGTISGRNGTGSYSALNFSVEDVSVRFDGQNNIRGYTDPYLKASGKTSVKTKADSTGYSGYETVYLKIVTKDRDGVIIDSEGARISDISIVLVDEFGNSWLEKSGGISGLDTGGTAKDIFAGAVDTRLFSPILSPIENLLGRFLGAQVSIRPNVSGNFFDRELGYLEIPESYAEYFVGSEFYISKFITDDLALTWNSKYIGSEEYIEISEREYGYRNTLGFDYRLNNYIYTSIGYQYNSISEEYGYNMGISYRYRFLNISEPYNYVKNFLRLR